MADSSPYKQIGEKVEYFSKYNLTTVSFIGEDSAISSLASTSRVGTKYQSTAKTVVKSSITEKLPSDQSKWTCSYRTYLSGGGGGSDDGEDEIWSMAMTQIEYSLMKYLSADEAYQYQAWKDTNISAKQGFKYLADVSQGAGTEIYEPLTGKALDVAKKDWNGTEAVLKFYPQATRTSFYSEKKTLTSRAEKLNHIDTASVSAMSDYDVEWLKSGFDWTENQDGTWTLTETWIGAPKWDEDLYGQNAWKFVGE